VFAASAVVGVVLVLCTVPLRVPTCVAERDRGAPGGMATLLRLPGLVRALVISAIVLAAVDSTLVYLPALGADRGLAAGFVGVLLMVRATASMTSRLFLGRLARWVGRRRLMIVSVATSALAMLAVTVPMPPAALVLVVVLLGLGLGVGQPLTMSWLAEGGPTRPARAGDVVAAHREPAGPSPRPQPRRRGGGERRCRRRAVGDVGCAGGGRPRCAPARRPSLRQLIAADHERAPWLPAPPTCTTSTATACWSATRSCASSAGAAPAPGRAARFAASRTTRC
jgi:hypothetical protein